MFILLISALFAMESNTLKCTGDISLSHNQKQISLNKEIDGKKLQTLSLAANGKKIAKFYPYGGLHWVTLEKKSPLKVTTDKRTYISFKYKEKSKSLKTLDCKLEML